MKLTLGLVLLTMVLGSANAATPPTGRYKAIVDKLNVLQQKYSAISSIFSIGQNDEGTELYAIRVSTTPGNVDPKKIGHLVVGTHHGNELAAATFTMNFLEEMLKRYTSSEVFRGNLADTEWTIIPVLNVTGYNGNNRYEYNKDPNRDYPCPCPGGQFGRLKSVRALMQHLTTRTYTGTLTVHGYVGSLTFPWGVFADVSHTHDHNAYDKIVAKAASLNGYQHGTHTDIVYPANNTYEDFTYWKYGMWTLLLELKDGSADDIKKTTDATFSFFDQLDSTPSQKNQFDGKCSRNIPDLRVE